MYIYGKNVLKEKLNSNEKINKVFLAEKFKDYEIIKLLKEKKVKVNYVPVSFLDRKVDGLHQGVVMEVDEEKTYSLDEVISNIDKEYPLLVMLDHLEDPHNFGAIIRTCEALGVDGIIIPNDRSVSVNGTVIKTSAGAIEHIKIIRVTNLVKCINYLKKSSFWIVGSDMSSTSIGDIDVKMPICLVIGNEGHGMSRLVRESCDYVVSIPMEGKVNSLNASVSCAIILSRIVSSRGI